MIFKILFLLISSVSAINKELNEYGQPYFSWDNVQPFWHAGSYEGLTDDAIDFITEKNFVSITIEKFEGLYDVNNNYEDNFIGVLNKIKNKDKNIPVIFYQNTAMNFPNYKLNCEYPILKKYINFAGEGLYHSKNCSNGNIIKDKKIYLFDFNNPLMLEKWYKQIEYINNLKLIDGIFLDRCVYTSNKLWNKNHLKAIDYVAKINTKWLTICNNINIRGIKAVMIERFFVMPNEYILNESIQRLINYSKNKIVQIHVDKCGTYYGHKEISLAGFLIGMSKHSYYSCNNRFEVTSQDSNQLVWYDEYNKFLGEPLFDAIINKTNDYIHYIRHFKGANVYLISPIKESNTLNLYKSCICWNDSSETCFNTNCKDITSII